MACFDTPRKDNIRNKQHTDYKSNRKESPEYLHHQFKMIRQICETLNMNVCELKDTKPTISWRRCAKRRTRNVWW